jgi:hypothetical protein
LPANDQINEKPLDSLLQSGSTVEEQQETTQFIDTGAEEVTLASPYSNISDIDEVTSIKRFLARPQRIYSGYIDDGTPSLLPVAVKQRGQQQPFKSFFLPREAMTPEKIEKLNFYRWFKCDVRLRVQFVANPYVAGRIIVVLSPTDPYLWQPFGLNSKGIRGITSHPHLEIDLQQGTAGEILVPWCGTLDAGDLTALDTFKNCYIGVYLITPLEIPSNGVNSRVPIQIFASLENVTLSLPTPKPAVLQGWSRQVEGELQGRAETRGPITEIASKIGKASGLFKKIPVVGTIASSAEWVSNLTEGVASIFGWSKPIDCETMPVTNIPGRGYNNYRGKDDSVVLGMDCQNQIVEKRELSPDECDEMSINYAASRPALVAPRRWLDSDPADSIITAIRVGPSMYEDYYDDPVENRPVVDLSIGDYICANFRYWRGDVRFRLSVVKTQFHAGRLEIFYLPVNNRPTDGEMSALDTTNCHRQFLDISSANDVEIVIPYNHSKILLETPTDDSSALGFIVVRVASPLVAPATVSSAVRIHLWKSYDNLIVSGNTNISLTPLLATTPAPKTVEANLQGLKSISFGDPNGDESLIEACSTVSGEACVNLRLATRGFTNQNFATETNSRIRSFDFVYFPGPLGLCANIYAFYRGGFSHKFITGPGVEVFSHVMNKETDDPARYGIGSHYTNSDVTPLHEITVPFYSTHRRLLCGSGTETLWLSVAERDGSNLPTDTRWLVAGKDDLTFSFLRGPSLLVFRSG